MPMRNPPHPGRGLKDDIDALGLTMAEAADALGITRQQLYNVINGKSGITPEIALRLEKGLGGTAEAWLAMQAAYDLVQLRSVRSTLGSRSLRGAWRRLGQAKRRPNTRFATHHIKRWGGASLPRN